MSKSIKSFIVLGFVALVAACGAAEEEVVIEDIPAEPEFSKF